MSTLSYINNKVKTWSKTILNTTRLTTLLVMTMLPLATQAQPAGKYTNDHPLIIAGSSSFPPYQFLSTSNQPTGHDVDILGAILTYMNIPHKFVLTEWERAVSMFEHHEADLIFDFAGQYRQPPYYGSSYPLSFFKYAVATRTGKQLITINQLKAANNVVIVSNDEATDSILRRMAPKMEFKKMPAKEAIIDVCTNGSDFFIWGEETMKWLIKELHLTSEITLNDIGIPTREICIAGYDKELIDEIDDQYARLQQNGRTQTIHDKWMHPERPHNNVPFLVIYITVAILILAFGLALANILSKRRLLAVTSKATDAERMMRQALKMGNIRVFSHDVGKERYMNLNGNFFPPEGYTREQFVERIHPDDREKTQEAMEKMLSGHLGIWEVALRWNNGSLDKPEWIYMHGYSICEQDEDGHTRYIISAVRNVTKDYEEERTDEELATKYAKMFNSTLIAISFYDKDGRLLDLNDSMRTLCKFDTVGGQFFREANLFDMPFFKKDLNPRSRDNFHVCHRMHYPEIGIDKYLEVRVMPTYDNDELKYFIATARDVTPEREMYKKLEQQNKELHQTNETITRYERELRYLLENCDMWVWRSDIRERRFSLSRSLQRDEYSESFDEYLENIDERFRPEARKAYFNTEGTPGPINTILLFKRTPVYNTPHWLASNGIPVFDAEGCLKGYFGVVRDVTGLMRVQERLKKEKKRAEDSGKLKSMFLANMTHEIRTPLNAIVGFSDLLQMIDNPEERREFIRIIRNNCDMLMRLINDIIEASNMDQSPLAIETEKVDFAVAFDDICQTLAQRVEEPGVEFITDNPYRSFVTVIDKGRLQQVITNFTTNAVKYTHQGHIKVGYRYTEAPPSSTPLETPSEVSAPEDGHTLGLYLYCEDTGTGIPKDKQASVFERFVKLNDYVQGTGLGLSICKNIAERCNGRIGVESKGEGHGSTFWIWIPCERLLATDKP